MPDEYFYILLRSLTSTHYPAHYYTSLLGVDSEHKNCNYASTRIKTLEEEGFIQTFKKEAVFDENNKVIEKTRTSLFFLPNAIQLNLEQMHRDTFLRKYPYTKKTVLNRITRLIKRVLEVPKVLNKNNSYIKFDIKDVKYNHFDLVNDYYYSNIYDKVSNFKTIEYIKLNLRESGFVGNDSSIEINHIYAQNLIFKYFQGVVENKIRSGSDETEALDYASLVLNKLFFTDNSLKFKAIILWKLIYRLSLVKKTKYPIISEFCDSYVKARAILDDVIEKSVITLNDEVYKIPLSIQHLSILVEAAMNVIRFYPTRYQDNEFTNYGIVLFDNTKNIPSSTSTIDLFNIIKNHKFFVELRELYKECSNTLSVSNSINNTHIKKKRALREKENKKVHEATSEIQEEFVIDDKCVHITDTSSFIIAKNKFSTITKKD